MDAFVRAVEWLRLLLVHVPGLAPLAAAPYLFRPLLMVLALGAAGAVVGVLVNLRCAEFHAEALVHAVFPGIVAGAVYWGIDAIIPAASVVAVAAALVLTIVSHRSRRGDASEAGTAVEAETTAAAMAVLRTRSSMSSLSPDARAPVRSKA